MAMPRILLIDDNQTRTQQLEIVLQFLEYQVEITTSIDFQEESLRANRYFAVFVDYDCVHQAAILTMLDSLSNKPLILLLINKTENATKTIASNALLHKLIEWPATYSELKQSIDSATTASLPLSPPKIEHRHAALERLQGISPVIVNVRKLILQVAESDATVLILGESGTGKEVVARALHETSSRRSKLFVPINCGAIPAELLESELFGHEKGAFTGALSARQGRFEMAEGGTLFLDEIGDMPMAMQVKLLRVLQERTFERVGSNKTIYSDVRVIAATHRSLEQEIKDHRFREDLFYRLNVFPIEMPALRERPEDIPLLVNDLLARLQAANRGSVSLTQAAMTVLMQYDWPGNIRELANLIERLTIIYPSERVDARDLPEKFQCFVVPDALHEQASNAAYSLDIGVEDSDAHSEHEELLAPLPVNSPIVTQLPAGGIDLKEYLNIMEIELIRQALEESNGVVAHAAKRLNMRRTTLVEKLRKYEMQR